MASCVAFTHEFTHKYTWCVIYMVPNLAVEAPYTILKKYQHKSHYTLAGMCIAANYIVISVTLYFAGIGTVMYILTGCLNISTFGPCDIWGHYQRRVWIMSRILVVSPSRLGVTKICMTVFLGGHDSIITAALNWWQVYVTMTVDGLDHNIIICYYNL